MYRDLGYYWLRLAIYMALGLGLGTVYHNIGHSYDSIQVREYFKKSGKRETINNTIWTNENRSIN